MSDALARRTKKLLNSVQSRLTGQVMLRTTSAQRIPHGTTTPVTFDVAEGRRSTDWADLTDNMVRPTAVGQYLIVFGLDWANEGSGWRYAIPRTSTNLTVIGYVQPELRYTCVGAGPGERNHIWLAKIEAAQGGIGMNTYQTNSGSSGLDLNAHLAVYKIGLE